MCVREIRGLGKWRCGDERGREEYELCGMREREIVRRETDERDFKRKKKVQMKI